jgi:hypothetical protein
VYFWWELIGGGCFQLRGSAPLARIRPRRDSFHS